MNIETIKRIDRLIRIKAGNAAIISAKLELTERAIYKYIKYMRTDLKAPIAFDSTRSCYLYSEAGTIELTWQPLKK